MLSATKQAIGMVTCYNGRPFFSVTLTLQTFIWLDQLVITTAGCLIYIMNRFVINVDHGDGLSRPGRRLCPVYVVCMTP